MAYEKAKVYFDGSHYIAIPHTEGKARGRPPNRRCLSEESEDEYIYGEDEINDENRLEFDDYEEIEEVIEECDNNAVSPEIKRKFNIKDCFEETYKEYIGKSKKGLRKKLWELLRPHFKDNDSCRYYIEENIRRKQNNLIRRRVRMSRKANLADFNYFVTFTYDGSIHTEESFKKKLRKFLTAKVYIIIIYYI